jgi:gas vesicle protein
MTDPEEIKRDIERTRAELSNDVNALSEKVSPSQIVQRRAERLGSGVSRIKDRVMGNASEQPSGAGGAIRSTSSAAGEALSSAASTVSDVASAAPGAARHQAQGNPLAAGLVAFGLGWLISSLLPASQTERQVGSQVKDAVSDMATPLAQQAQDAVKEVAQNLREPAQEAVDDMKSTATDFAANVTAEARSAASDVTDAASSSGQDRYGR